MEGRFVIVHMENNRYLFVRCPSCGHLTHVPGKAKYKKAQLCYGCSQHFTTPATMEGANEYEVNQTHKGLF